MPGCRRGNVVSSVHDENVERARISWMGWQNILEHPHRHVPLQPVDRCHEPWEMRPWVRVNPTRPPQLLEQQRIDDPELKPELVPHLIPPLDLQRGWTHNKDAPGPMTK